MTQMPTGSYNTYFKGGGEMGHLTRSFDWCTNKLGDPQSWPPSLLTTVSIILRSKFPMFLWWGPELIQFYNDAYRPSMGNMSKHPHALGQRGEDCWQEIWSTIKPLIDQVMEGGESIWCEDQLIPIYRNNQMEDVYWTFSYSSVIGESGNPGGVLVICHETTEKVVAHKNLKKAAEDIQQARIAAENQRDRLNTIFMQAPVGICILSGEDYTYEFVNPSYQQLFPGRDLLGKSLLEALPEFKNSPVWDILKDVYQNNKGFEGKELLVPLARHAKGEIEERYFNFIYQPRHQDDTIIGIIVIVFEVTDLVQIRKNLETTRDTLQLSLEAAELGTFDMDLIKGTMKWDDRCRTLFGIKHHDAVTYEQDFVKGVHPDDKERVLKVIGQVLSKAVSNGDYDVEYRTIGAEDQKTRWVRAKGKAYFNKEDRPIRFLGAVLDITEQKSDEIRKNDFIGMVSHELKTPLTSLSVIVQLLSNKFKESEDFFIVNGLKTANGQILKMTSLINGFLNISRLESGKIYLNRENFVLNELIHEMVEESKLSTNSHLVEIQTCGTLTVYADRDKISSVITNFISNAIKYSPADSHIRIECKNNHDYVQVSVSDKGMGIKTENLEKIFDRYYRVETDLIKHISGFGIGLYLCAEIIKQHTGKIWVESEVGVGSTFHFSLPISSK